MPGPRRWVRGVGAPTVPAARGPALDDPLLPVRVPVFAATGTISAGGAHTCAIRVPGGAAYCWGYNEHGAVGNGTNVTTPTPTLVSPPRPQRRRHLRRPRTHVRDPLDRRHPWTGVRALRWGANDHGQLGDGTLTDRWTPVRWWADGIRSPVSVTGERTYAVTTAALMILAALIIGYFQDRPRRASRSSRSRSFADLLPAKESTAAIPSSSSSGTSSPPAGTIAATPIWGMVRRLMPAVLVPGSCSARSSSGSSTTLSQAVDRRRHSRPVALQLYLKRRAVPVASAAHQHPAAAWAAGAGPVSRR